jgi:hypothetical protein
MFCAMLTKFHYITNLKKGCKVDFGHFTEPPSPPLLIEVPALGVDYTCDLYGRFGCALHRLKQRNEFYVIGTIATLIATMSTAA